MTSFRQIEANRRNANRSTGPVTDAGKERSRRNAVRHGLTAETVIGALEDAEDYKLFEAAVTADFNPETAVERELVLRLASLLWRLRRAASIETGMFQTATRIVAEEKPEQKTFADPGAHVRASSAPISVRPIHPDEIGTHQTPSAAQFGDSDCTGTPLGEDIDPLLRIAGRFLHLAAMDKGAFERLGRYETALWRQVCQTVFMLDSLRRQSLDMKWLSRSSRGCNFVSPSLFTKR